MEKEPNVLKQYADLKAKHPDRMLLFRNDRYYQLFNDDAKEAVRILGINGVQFRNDPDTAMALFEHEKLDTYLPKLIRSGKRVAICDMLPDPPKTKRGITETINNESTNNQTSEDKTMATKKNNNETKNVQNAQVNNNAAAIEDVNVGEVTVDSIMPVMQPVEEEKADVRCEKADVRCEKADVRCEKADVRCEKADVKPQTSSIEHHPSNIIHHPSSIEHQVQDSVPQAGKYQYVTYEVKKVNKTTKKEYTVTGSKIVGFELADPIYLAGPAFCGAISTESVDGKTVGALRFSHKWTPAVKDVCDLLNSGKATLEGCVAIINGAKAERSERIQERIAKREERKAKKSEKGTVKSEKLATAQAAAPAMSDEEQAMFDLFKKFMAGDKDAMAKVGAVLQAA